MRTLRTLLFGIALCALLLVAGCVLLPSALHRLNLSVTYRIPDVGKTLYITLDDGPSEATPLILDVLRKHNVPATFFVITDHIRPEMLNRITTEGHQIGHHMKTTANIQKMPDEQFRLEFLAADTALAQYRHVKLFRPPGGSISDQQAAFVTNQGYRIVVGTIFPLDHWLKSTTTISALAKILVIDGGIIILHDTQERGPRTAVVLNDVIPYLKKRGYKFDLLPDKSATP